MIITRQGWPPTVQPTAFATLPRSSTDEVTRLVDLTCTYLLELSLPLSCALRAAEADLRQLDTSKLSDKSQQ
jgi:hypothetical protein